MLNTGRRAATISLVSAIVVGFSSPAWADYFFGNAECGESGGPGCEVGAESGQSSSGSSGSDSGDSGFTGDSAVTVDAEPSECDLEPTCETFSQPTTGEVAMPDVTPVQVAHAARDALVVPEPQIVTSPGEEVPVLVHVPVWLWIGEDVWEEQTAEATVPGGSVTVAAAPAQAEWDMGDGSTVVCDGPGTAYDPDEHDPSAGSPTCGHTYTRASTVDPFPVEVAVTWEVSWSSSDGEGGDLDDLVTSESTARSVIESHGLVTGVD